MNRERLVERSVRIRQRPAIGACDRDPAALDERPAEGCRERVHVFRVINARDEAFRHRPGELDDVVPVSEAELEHAVGRREVEQLPNQRQF